MPDWFDVHSFFVGFAFAIVGQLAMVLIVESMKD